MIRGYNRHDTTPIWPWTATLEAAGPKAVAEAESAGSARLYNPLHRPGPNTSGAEYDRYWHAVADLAEYLAVSRCQRCGGTGRVDAIGEGTPDEGDGQSVCPRCPGRVLDGYLTEKVQ